MANPYEPPRRSDADTGTRAERRVPEAWPDWLLAAMLLFAVGPAVMVNALVWFEAVAGLGIYDPQRGDDPLGLNRPFAMPLAVLAITSLRLGVASIWRLASSARWAITSVALLSLVTAIASLTPLPHPPWSLQRITDTGHRAGSC